MYHINILALPISLLPLYIIWIVKYLSRCYINHLKRSPLWNELWLCRSFFWRTLKRQLVFRRYTPVQRAGSACVFAPSRVFLHLRMQALDFFKSCFAGTVMYGIYNETFKTNTHIGGYWKTISTFYVEN